MMQEFSNPGHLLIFFKEDKKYYLYLYIREVGKPFCSLVVLPGIKKISKKMSISLEISQFSKYHRIPMEFPDIKENLIAHAPIEIFLDGSEKFKESLFKMCLGNLLKGYSSIFPIREIGPVARDYSFVRYNKNFDNVIEKYILKSKNVIIDSPRRGGKTSFMKQLVEEKKLKDYVSFYIDMETARYPVQFAAKIVIELSNKSKRFNSEIEKRKAEIHLEKEMGSNYRLKVEEIFREKGNTKLILAIDECSFFIEEMIKSEKSHEKIIDFLNWFKRIRQEYQNICFVFSGSVKVSVFEKVLDERGFFEDCVEYSLKPFDKESAVNLVEGLFYSEEVYPPEYVTKEIVRLTTPCFPYFLQIVTNEMLKFYRIYKKFPDKKRINFIIDSEIIGTSCRRYLDQLLINLRRYNKLEEKGARAVLHHLSEQKSARVNNLEAIYKRSTGTFENFEKTMALLEYDFYIERKGDKYSFNNEIIRKWWKINFVGIG